MAAHRRLLAVLGAIAVAVSACDQEVAGRAKARPGTEPLPPSLSPQARQLMQMDPCALDPDGIMLAMGAASPVRNDYHENPGCRWAFPGGNGLTSLQMWLNRAVEEVQTELGLDTSVDYTIGQRHGRLITDDHGKCWVAIPVGRKARVDVVSTYRVDTDTACARSIALAHAVEPQLPQ